MNQDTKVDKLFVANLILLIFTVAGFFGLVSMFIWGLFFDWKATLGITAGTIGIGAFIWALMYSYEHSP